MAASAGIVWEVRGTGAATNSGGFDPALGGTDYSQQNAPQYTLTDIAIDGADNTKITSATHNFVAADVGNTIRITAGVNFTQAVYQITSAVGNAAFLDRGCGTVGSTAGTGNVGGAFDNLTTMFAVNALVFVAGATIYVKAATFSPTVGYTSSKAGTRAARISLIGYTTTRSDNGQVTIQPGASYTALLTVSGAYWDVQNFIFQGQNGAFVAQYGVQAAAGQAWVENCKAINCQSRGFYVGADGLIIRNCWAVSCGLAVASNAAGGFYFTSGAGIRCEGCVADSCYYGFNCNASTPAFMNCIARAASVDSYLFQGQCSAVMQCCTSRSPVTNGVKFQDATSGECSSVLNCLFASSGAGDINSASTNYATHGNFGRRFRNNAFYNSGGARYTNIDASGGVGDITVSVDPFKGATDNTLNGAPTGGGIMRGTGWPGAFPDAVETGYVSVGAVQPPGSVGRGRVYGAR